jgi:hypothetical protein
MMVINVVFKKNLTWHVGEKMQVVMTDLKNSHGILNVMAIIDGIHIATTKPFGILLLPQDKTPQHSNVSGGW